MDGSYVYWPFFLSSCAQACSSDPIMTRLLPSVGFQYVYIIAGDEVIAFFKDILRFLARRPNNRFSNMFYRFGRQYQTQYQEDPYALEKAILNTPTWWDSPTKYKRMIKAYLASLSSSDNEEYDSS